VCARAWQQGSDVAGYLFIALLVWSGSVLFRIMLIYGLWPESETSNTWFMLFLLIEGVWFLSSFAVGSLRARREVVELRADASSQLAMFARISHELRTPLDTILGNAQLLLRQHDRPPERVVLKTMLDSGRHLLGMVDELLDYARGLVGALKVAPAPTRFDIWWAGLARTGELLAVRNQNRFVSSFDDMPQPGNPLVLCLDAGRLRQVIDNLLVNASRYTHLGVITLGGALEVQTRAPYQQYLSLYVEDTGCGIDPKDHKRIFEPFERLNRKTLVGGSGTGMGLAIARQLVGLMGGELTVLSALNRGTRFTVKIPVTRSSESVSDRVEMSLASARGYAGDRRRLLIVDDDDRSRDVLVRLLQSIGFDVSEASSGREAEAMLESGRPFDAVLTDQFMADGDGWWVLWAVHERQPDTPVLLISAALPHAPLGWTSSARFAATFLRPVQHIEVLRKLGDLLDLRWIFDPAPSAPVTDPLIRPDARSLSQLRELVAFGEITAIREWSRALRDRDPLFEGFSLAVEQAAIELDFGRLELLAAEL
jgi:signal transduction histidine kinase/CheY-like chemotaxis protein